MGKVGRGKPARTHSTRGGVAATAAIAVAALPLAGPAAAQEPLPENNAGTGQYVEPVPDAGGDRRAAPDQSGPRRALPEGTRSALPPGREGQILERLGSDPGSGAQDESRAADVPAGGGSDENGGGGSNESRRGAGSGTTGPAPLGGDRSALGAATSAVAGGDNRGVQITLLVLMALTVATGFALAARRRRSK